MGWRSWSCLLVAVALPAATLAVPQSAAPAPAAATPAPAPAAVAQLLEAQVRAAWTAFKSKDRAAYARFLTDDFQAVEADGEGERSRLHVLGEVEHCMFSDYLLQMFQVQPLGADYAFVTYESSMQFPKGSALRLRRVFIGELWTRRSGRWQMMRYQETLVR
jgi:ketosteroid isomerase-like protein